MPSRDPPRWTLALAAVIVLLGAAGWLVGEQRRAGKGVRVEARGTFWTAHTKHGGVLSVDTPTNSLPLRPGDVLRLDEPEGDGVRIERLALRVQKWGNQSSLVDLRLRDRASDWLRLTLVPGPQVTADLVLQTAAGTSRPLASSTTPVRLVDPAAPFELVVRLVGDRLEATLEGQPLLAAELDGDAEGRISLWADGLRVHHLAVEGSRPSPDGGAQAFSLGEDFGLLTNEPDLGQRLRPLLAVAACLALAGAWLASLPAVRPGLGRTATAVVVGLAPPALLTAVALFRPLPAELLTIGTATLAVIGLTLALPRVTAPPTAAAGLGSPERDARPHRAWQCLRAVGLALGCSAWAVVAVGGSVDVATGPHLAALQYALTSPSGPAWSQPAPLVLGPDNALAAPGPWRNLTLEARVRLDPGALLEVRLRGSKGEPLGVALLLSADPRLASGFVLESDGEFSPVGSSSGAVEPDREHALTVSARSTRLSAHLDGRVVAEADVLEHASGGVFVLAPAGRARVEGLLVEPLAPETDPPTSLSLTLEAGAPLVLGLPLLALLAAALLRRPWLALLETLAFAWVPLALGAPGEETLGRLSIGGWGSASAAAAAIALTGVLVQGRGSSAARRLLAGAAAIATPALLLVAALGAPDRADRASRVSYEDFAGPRLLPGLVHFQHPLVRRYNTWLRDHRFRGREIPLEKPPGTLRVLCVGSSSTWGHGIPEGKPEDYPTVLGRLLAEREPGRPVEVINGAVRGTTAARMLWFLREVLLQWQPDILTVSFSFNDSVHLTHLDEGPWLERITAPDYEHGLLERWHTAREVAQGRRDVSTLSGALAGTKGDTLAAWRAIAGEREVRSPPERFAAILRAYAELCAERGIALVLIKEPVSGSTHRLWKREFYAAIDAVAQETGATVVDPWPALVARGGEQLFMDAVHPLPAGHVVVAETLLPVIRRLIRER